MAGQARADHVEGFGPLLAVVLVLVVIAAKVRDRNAEHVGDLLQHRHAVH